MNYLKNLETMKVTLRKKMISKSRKSLYLDYYPPILNPDKGKLTRREFLGLYIYDKPKNELEKSHNKQTTLLAENVCARRQIEIQNNRYGFLSESKKEASFTDYFKSISAKKKGTNLDGWRMAARYFESFAGPDFRFKDINIFFCDEYKEYLLSSPSITGKKPGISNNTAVSYFAKFRSMLRVIYKQGLLDSNLYELVLPIKEKESIREILTIEEFQKLVHTPSSNDLLKRAAIFSGLTGFRFSDIESLKWSEVGGSLGSYYILFKQNKTDKPEYMPISNQVYELLGERLDGIKKVFYRMKYSHVQSFLIKWLAKAGIEKHITFHSFRHTYATLQLTFGTDIYTVSKMLGHKYVTTTQRYTKVVDSKKKETTHRIMLDLNSLDVDRQ